MKKKFRIKGREYEVKSTLVDNIVNFFDPIKGNQRFRARISTALAGSYTGASTTRRATKNWITSNGDADADLLDDLPELRERSRDAIRNINVATGAINTVCTSVVGPGLRCKPSINAEYIGLTDDQANELERIAEFLFNTWASSIESDLYRTNTFFENQNLAFRTILEAGDGLCLMHRVSRIGSPFKLKTQLIEADRLTNRDNEADSQTKIAGIHIDGLGAPKAYDILETHPGNDKYQEQEWKTVPAFGSRSGRRNVLHIFEKLRPGQHRGIPYLAPVIEPLKQLGRYSEAELMAAVVSGMFTVFITSDDGDAELAPYTGDSNINAKTSDEDYQLGYGSMIGLAKGESVETTNPGRPNAAFDPFVQAILRQIGVALEIPFEILIKHFTASYSASRAALLEAWRFFHKRRAWLAANFCQPIYEEFFAEQVAAGRIKAPGFFTDPLIRAAYCGAEWVGRPQGQIDPLKENNADVIAEDRGWKTASENTAEKTGGDWEKKHKQRAREIALRKKDGLENGSNPSNNKDASNKEEESNDEEDNDDQDRGDLENA